MEHLSIELNCWLSSTPWVDMERKNPLLIEDKAAGWSAEKLTTAQPVHDAILNSVAIWLQNHMRIVTNITILKSTGFFKLALCSFIKSIHIYQVPVQYHFIWYGNRAGNKTKSLFSWILTLNKCILLDGDKFYGKIKQGKGVGNLLFYWSRDLDPGKD